MSCRPLAGTDIRRPDWLILLIIRRGEEEWLIILQVFIGAWRHTQVGSECVFVRVFVPTNQNQCGFALTCGDQHGAQRGRALTRSQVQRRVSPEGGDVDVGLQLQRHR